MNRFVEQEMRLHNEAMKKQKNIDEVLWKDVQPEIVTNRSFLIPGGMNRCVKSLDGRIKLNLWDKLKIQFNKHCPTFFSICFPFKYRNYKLIK